MPVIGGVWRSKADFTKVSTIAFASITASPRHCAEPNMQVLSPSPMLFDFVATARCAAATNGRSDDAEAMAEAVVPWSRELLQVALASIDGRADTTGIPGEWAAVRRWLVLVVAAHLDAGPVAP